MKARIADLQGDNIDLYNLSLNQYQAEHRIPQSLGDRC